MTDSEREEYEIRKKADLETALKTVDKFIQMEESMNATPFFEFKFSQDKKRLHPKWDISYYYGCTQGGLQEPDCDRKNSLKKNLKNFQEF